MTDYKKKTKKKKTVQILIFWMYLRGMNTDLGAAISSLSWELMSDFGRSKSHQ